ncbi:MAG: hypothetical protein AAFN08_05185 [Cyanobacteria bacterium J06559_3]
MARSRNNPVLNSELWNCENAFEIKCPMRWASLKPTDHKDVRHCDRCRQSVYRCYSAEEFVEHGNAGRCVAIPEHVVPGLERTTELLGRVSSEGLERMMEESRERQLWWHNVTASNPEFNVTEHQQVQQHLQHNNFIHSGGRVI